LSKHIPDLTSAALAALFRFWRPFMAGLYPLSRMQQFDGNGRLLSGARLFLFDGGTSTPRIGYRDSSLTSPHPNPIVADSAGRLPLIYLDDGFYRHRLTSKAGTLIFDDDGLPVLSATEGGSGTSVDPDSVFKTRDIKIRFDDQPLAGYVRLNGRTIGSAASGATERANADTQSLYEELWGFANISVTGGKGGSAAADFAANKPLVLPDAAGRGIFGADDLGAGNKARLSSYIPNSTLQGSVGGNQAWTLQFNNLPVSCPWTGSVSGPGTTALSGASHTHAFSGSTGGVSATHTHSSSYTGPGQTNAGAAGGSDQNNLWRNTAATGLTTGAESNDHTHAFSGTTGVNSADHGHTFNFSASVSFGANGGGGQPIDKTPPLMTFTIYIRL
jgi:hypothetical protein